ncbi:MAG TPA: transcription-repair coupling factor, partial [Bacillota bacterium]|nr:transcription-repair coupling factor [Bacillota bacterium]
AFTAENEVLSDDIASYVSGGYKTLVACSTRHSASSVKELLSAKDIKCLPYDDQFDNGAVYTTTKIIGQPGGFEFAKERFAFFCEGNTEQAKKLVRRRRAYSGGSDREKIASYADLSPGDLVVHENHGIGRYDGIKKLTVEGITKDYIKIQYEGTDVLYVPCNSLDLVSKYIGAGTGTKKLSKLGGTDWYKAKEKAKKSAKSIARELIAVYSERMKQPGFAFSHDDDLQSEFESHFDYVETYGQLKACEEIKHDMERNVPMDRLLCGDVGFGKTEVALRAAFKCVEDGKQAAILVPTTILAYQHFQTLLSRFRSFPVKCEMVSRFRTKQQQDEILRRLKHGDVDIIVGTHRLLQKDVVFKDLGLLVVDEEQRFGVTHKEKLKQLAVNVDVLTLTATPIPRTLNMALSGIRDMSVLEEAPQDRVPVQTYVLEYDDLIINEAIRKELRRGGQVFFLHNNIDTIYNRASKLQEAFPDANISVGHGKLTREQLSEIWESLVRGDTDILVCTTIIETGVDVANANTLIIEDADRFGLSQLHQIRGRVGRSARKAYAYLTFKQDRELTEIAQKRLEALSEFTEFGSGFKIAMRDLELRGAGDLLGAQQHGNIESVGYDLFVRILEEQVSEEKGEKKQTTRDCQMDIAVDAYIPERYIEASQQRIDIYRKIALLSNEDECIDLQTELIDRYGSVPVSVMNLMEISMIRNMACSLGMNKISSQSNGIYFWFASMDMHICSALAAKDEMRGKLLLSAGSKPYLYYKMPAGDRMLSATERVLQLYTEISQKQYGQNNPESV